MNLQAFFECFGRLTEAPSADAKLRKLIRELSNQGQFRIFSTSAECVSTWKRFKVGEVADLIMGQAPPGSACNKSAYGTVFVKAGEFGKKYPVIREWTTRPLRLAKTGDLLICVVGATAGKLNFGIDCAIGRSVAALRPKDCITTEYLFNWLQPRILSIRKESRGSAQGVLTREFLEQMEILIPPLEVQEHIVAKVDELTRICDELEAAQHEKRENRVRLNDAVVWPLNRAASLSPQELETAVARLASNFETLYQSVDAVGKLRSTILQLAVQGKLVPQDSDDESASALLQRVKDQQQQLITEGRIKPITLSPIDWNRTPFQLPRGWTWARFPELGEFSRGRSKHRPRNAPELYVGGKYKLVQTGDVARSNGTITTFTGLYNDAGLAQSRMWPAGTMCITIAANIADSGILAFDACFPDSVVGFVPSSIIGGAQYFEYFMRTAKSHLQDFAPSTAQKNINISILQDVLIPLPPLAEQKRIVAKVNQLMALCDDLEAKQRQAEDNSEKLINAAVQHVLNVVAGKNESQRESALALSSTEM